MKSRFAPLRLALVAALMLFLALAGGRFAALRAQDITNPNDTSAYAKRVLSQIEKIGRTMILINNHYVDTIAPERMADGVIERMVTSLDPHSNYIPADQVAESNEHLMGQFSGVGIEFAMISDTVTVQRVISGGPSEQVGLLVGDKIIRVDSTLVSGCGFSSDKVRSMLRGDKDTKVTVNILRRSLGEPVDFTITRGVVPLNSVESSYCPEPGVLYVRLSNFARTSALEIIEAFRNLTVDYPEGVILDLRGNSGGFVNSAITIANMFMEEGQTVLFTEGTHSPLAQETLTRSGFYSKGPLVLLIDGTSASASEILAGAIQDWDRGLIVGQRSFGKGLVQRMFTLADGSQIRLTTARYHTPSGRVIQTPYEEDNRKEYYQSKLHIGDNDSIPVPDSLVFHTLLRQRRVYGGGGILPDYVIEQDTTRFTKYAVEIFGKGCVAEYANIYCDADRDGLKARFPDFDSFMGGFSGETLSEALEGLYDFAQSRGVERDNEGIAPAETLIRTRFKALVARNLFSPNEYFRVLNTEDDPEFRKALDLIHHWPAEFPDHR